jgi:hypothetical protein
MTRCIERPEVLQRLALKSFIILFSYSVGDKWKHDKFREEEEDRAKRREVMEDNKPSSTTENK